MEPLGPPGTPPGAAEPPQLQIPSKMKRASRDENMGLRRFIMMNRKRSSLYCTSALSEREFRKRKVLTDPRGGFHFEDLIFYKIEPDSPCKKTISSAAASYQLAEMTWIKIFLFLGLLLAKRLAIARLANKETTMKTFLFDSAILNPEAPSGDIPPPKPSWERETAAELLKQSTEAIRKRNIQKACELMHRVRELYRLDRYGPNTAAHPGILALQ
jgi:hypothetical protein